MQEEYKRMKEEEEKEQKKLEQEMHGWAEVVETSDVVGSDPTAGKIIETP